MRTLIVLLITLALSVGTIQAGSDSPLVLTNVEYKPKSDEAGITMLDPEDYSVLVSIPVSPNPQDFVVDSGNERLFLLSAGKQSAWDLTYKEPAMVSVLDIEEKKFLKKIELGNTPVGIRISRDGSTIVAVTAGRKKTPSKVTVIDPDSLEIRADVATGDEATAFRLSNDGRWVYLLQDTGKKSPRELVIVDTRNGKTKSKLKLATGWLDMEPSQDGSYLYIVYREHPATLLVMSMASGEVLKEIEIANEPGVLYAEPGSDRIYLPSRKIPAGPGGISIIQGDEVVRTIQVPGGPYGVKPGLSKKTMFMLEENGISLLDLAKGESLWRVPLEFSPFDLVLNSDRTNLYVSPRVGSAVTRIDLQDPAKTVTVKTGRKSVKTGRVLGTIAGVAVAAGGYSSVIFSPGHSLTTSLLGPEEKYLYVGNIRTNDVTVIDTDSFEIEKYIPTGKGTQALYLPPGSRFIAVEASRQVTLIDTNSRSAALTGEASAFGRLHYHAASRHMLVPRETALGIIDMATGKEIKTVTGIHKPQVFLEIW